MLRYWAWGYQNPTEAERSLEPAIAALGKRYRFQHPFFRFHHMADFVLLDDKIVIEVDGSSHNTPGQKIKDLKHTAELEALGYKVMRCKNEDAIRHPTETVAKLLAQVSQVVPLEAGATLLEIARLEAEIPPKKPRKSIPPHNLKKPKKPKKDWEFPVRPPLPM